MISRTMALPRPWIGVFGFFLVAAANVGAQNFDDVEIKTTAVAGSVYVLEGLGGNIGVLVGDDGILLVDDQFAPLADKIRSALAELSPNPIVFVLNTHVHGDHTGGNAVFGREAPVVAHTHVRDRLTEVLEKKLAETVTTNSLPVVTFDESLTLHLNGEEIEMIHLPAGHTDGDAVVLFKTSNVVHVGDLFHNGRNPIVDPTNGGTVDGYLANVAALLERLPEDVKIIPGHGPLATLDDYRAFYERIRQDPSVFVERPAGRVP